MKKLILLLFINVCISNTYAQKTIFDDTKLNSVYIYFEQDSLDKLYTDIFSDHYYKVLFVYDDGIKKDSISNAGFRLKGNTSRGSFKKSFKISFDFFNATGKYQGQKKLNLMGAHNDPTMIREKLFYECYGKIGLPSRKSNFVKLYINSAYFGLYTNLEEIDKNWLKGAYKDDLGNLYKCTYPADLAYLGTNPNLYKFQNGSNPPERAYDLKTNKLADNYTGFIALCNQLAQPVDANFEANIQKVINVKDYMKALAIDVALGNWDSYSINKNNFFLYQNSITGRFEFITYDADNTFGIRWGSADYGNLSVDKWVSKNRPLANKLLAVPSFRAQYIDNLRFICDKITHPDSINPRITAMKSMIQAAAVSDKYRTKDWGYTMTNLNDSYTKPIDDHTPYGLKTFLTTRCTSIYKQTTPTIDGQSWDAELLLFPNPASETLWLSLPQVSDQIFDCKIYNILGKKVLETTLQLGENGQQISIEHLPKGQYCILLMLDNQVFTNKKFIKI